MAARINPAASHALPINAAEQAIFAGCYSVTITVNNRTEYRLTLTFPAGETSVVVLSAKTREAAVVEAAEIRAGYQRFAKPETMPTMKLSAVAVRERVFETVLPDHSEDGEGERHESVTTRLAG